MTRVQEIAVAVVQADDYFLVGIRPDGVALAGYHEFPGGKVRSDETPKDAVARETLEETRLAVVVIRELIQQAKKYDHGTVQLHFWLATPVGWTPGERLPPVVDPFRWVSRGELGQLNFPDGNRQLLQILVEDQRPAS